MTNLDSLSERTTETHRVYAELKRDILAGTFLPGDPLQEVKLSARFGASRTPIREALLRLEADGLLTMKPRRGAFVHQPTIQDFLEINELRLILEPVAASLAAANISEVIVDQLLLDLNAIRSSNPGEDDFVALYDLDRRMHSVIAEAAGNTRMQHIINNLNDMMQVVRERDMLVRYEEMRESIQSILTSLRARDEKTTEDLLRDHIGSFSNVLPRLVRTNSIRSADAMNRSSLSSTIPNPHTPTEQES